MRKYRIRWDRVAMLLAALAVVCVAMYYIIIGIVSLSSWLLSLIGGISWCPESTERNEEPQHISEAQRAEALRMKERVDSFFTLPTRLEKEKIAISIYDITTRQQIFAYQEDKLLTPASCMKVATAVAALKSLGVRHRMKESVHVRGRVINDTLFGNLLLRADADPMLLSLDSLTDAVRNEGIRHIQGNIYLDLAHSDRLVAHPSAKVWDIPFNKTPLLLKGENIVRRSLMASLRNSGISFRKDDSQKPGGMYRNVASSSHGITEAMVPMMRNSSNIMAETVLYHLDHKHGRMKENRTDYSVRHVHEDFWRKVFADDSTHSVARFVFADGSGLSPENRLSARALTDMLRYAYGEKDIYEYFRDYAMASPGSERRGSLLTRMSNPEYRNRIFCKTGTMTTRGVSSIAGYLEGRDGHWYIFAIMNDDSPVAEARIYQDKLLKMMMK